MENLANPKISDVIAALERAKSVYGDLPVKSSEPGGYWAQPSITIDIDAKDEWLSIEGGE